ncbi:nucleotidyltransferase domain-containing protein [Bdellovibrio bacteriovorus]|uniref:nucleotidyltransferase domain-containing protein n=1 Tax=Bdellovibrio bacteriovorus TaxID=959 RepID=UPI0035A9553A
MAVADANLSNIIRILTKEFHPKRILLFGSRARGDHHSGSDYDLVLIDAVSSLPKVERMQRASDLLYPLGVTADVFFYSEEEFNDWKDEFSSIPEIASREGLELDLG